MSMMPFAYFNGSLTPLEDANISIASNSLQYGTSCFAGIRGYHVGEKIRLFRLEDHYERFMNASKIMGFNFYIEYEEFKNIIEQLIVKNNPTTDFYIRPFIYSKDLKLSPRPTGLTYELAIYLLPLASYFDQNQGMRLMVSSWRKFNDNSFPTKAKASGCYVNSFLATSEALRCGYDEALMMDQEGAIVEASVANILISYRDRIIMPPIGEALLEGITMRTMIEFIKEEGFELNFERIDRSMIYSCNELLLMGTAAQIAFAASLDGRPIGSYGESPSTPGPVCTLLRAKFADVIAKKHPKHVDWITEF